MRNDPGESALSCVLRSECAALLPSPEDARLVTILAPVISVSLRSNGLPDGTEDPAGDFPRRNVGIPPCRASSRYRGVFLVDLMRSLKSKRRSACIALCSSMLSLLLPNLTFAQA